MPQATKGGLQPTHQPTKNSLTTTISKDYKYEMEMGEIKLFVKK